MQRSVLPVHMSSILTLLTCTTMLRISLSVMDFALFVLTIGKSVDELADTKNDEVGDKLAEFGKCQEGKAEPQTEHSSEI